MPSYFDSYWGLQGATSTTTGDYTLTITDAADPDNPTVDEIKIEFNQSDSGWFLLGDGWTPGISDFKGGGTYNDSAIANGQHLKHTVFDNVVEPLQVGLNFTSGNDLSYRLEVLQELLKVRAPRYWKDRRNNKPVYLVRRQHGETNEGYFLLSQGQILLPPGFWDAPCLGNGVTLPFGITLNRQPFLLAAVPGQTQGKVYLSATQDWDYNLTWAEEDTTPAGQVFSFVETDTGIIYATGASEVLKWESSAWAAVTTTPVTLAADVLSSVVLTNGDILFGESGRIIKLSSGTWSVETTEPTGSVYALLQAQDGQVYAADNGRIIKRDVNGTWAEDDDLPSGQVYSLAQTPDGFLWAGEVGRILRTKEEQESNIFSQVSGYSDSIDDADETVAGQVTAYGTPDKIFDTNLPYTIFRYLGVTIPQGATIVSAKITFTAPGTTKSTGGSLVIYGEDVDDSAQPVEGNNSNISSRTLTTASKTWSNPVTFAAAGQYDTPDFANVVQEIINRAGWASGNNLSIIFNNTSKGIRLIRNHATITIEYTEARPSGETWEINTTLPAGNVRSLLVYGNTLLAGDDGQILSTSDSGRSPWKVVSTTPTNEVTGLRQLASSPDALYAGDNGNILKSADGVNWAVDSTLPASYVYDFIKETATGDYRAGDNGRVLILDASDTVTLGRTSTTNDEVVIANHHKTANLTHVKQDDGGAYTNLFPMASFPTALFPAVPAVNDAVYFIIDNTITDSGPFCNVMFDIGTPAKATTSYTIVYEYYNGAYTSLTVQDGTSQFSETGVNGIFFRMPSDWTATTVDGVTGLLFRARISALTGTLTPPTQQNRDIYSVITPFVDISKNEIEGVVPALGKIKIRTHSDNGGPGGSEPTLYATRYMFGVKETDNHASFRAFLNFADEQNPDGVSLDVTVDGDSTTSVENDTNFSSATGRRVFFDATGATLDTMADRAKLKLNTTIARDFYGTYKPFLRVKQNGGSAGQVKVQIKVVTGTGGISSLTDIKPTKSTTDHELIEFDNPITLPVATQFTPTDLADETSIIVRIQTASASADLYLYDIFLLPTDEMWIDTEDTANTLSSAIKNGTRLVVDSITIPKAPIRALVEVSGTGSFVSNYRIDSNGGLELLRRRAQRLWFMSARKSSVGGTVWISEPEVVSSVTLEKVERYLLGRGIG